MYGAILGDIIGSPFEFDRGDKTKEFDLFSRGVSRQYRRRSSHFLSRRIMRMLSETPYHSAAIQIRLERSPEVLRKHIMTCLQSCGLSAEAGSVRIFSA